MCQDCRQPPEQWRAVYSLRLDLRTERFTELFVLEVRDKLSQEGDARRLFRFLLLDRIQQRMDAAHITDRQKLPQLSGLLMVKLDLGQRLSVCCTR